MQCPNSANCPVRDKDGFGAYCRPFVASCVGSSRKCLGEVVCKGKDCPGVVGTLCFTLGASSNFKVRV